MKRHKRGHWTKESITEAAKCYSRRLDFKHGSPTAYSVALNLKIMDEICGHMDAAPIQWTDEMIKIEASRFSERHEFKNGSSAYCAAVRRGILDDVCSHMTTKKKKWSIDEITAEAKKYKTRTEFMNGNRKAYDMAQYHGILPDVCSHMTSGATGFDKNKSAILYYIKIDAEGMMPLYKIGITNRDINRRIYEITLNKGMSTTILKKIWFDVGAEAYELEQMLLREFKEKRYLGDHIMADGNTELFSEDILCYDNSR